MKTVHPEHLKVVQDISRPEILFSMARPSGASQLFMGASDAAIYAFDPAAEKPEVTAWEAADARMHSSYITGLVAVDDQLVSGSYDGHLAWRSVEDGTQTRKLKAHAKWVRGVVLSPDGKLLASVSDDMVCRLWEARSGKPLHELRGHEPRTPHHFPSMLFTAGFSADGKLLATADKVGHVAIWDVASGKRIGTVEAPEMYTWDPRARLHSIGGIRSVAFSPDGKWLAVGGINQIGNIDHLGSLARVEVFEWATGKRLHEFKGDTYKGLVERLVFHPREPWLLAAGGDHGGFIKFFDLNTGKIIKQDKAPMHVHDLIVDASWERVYAVGHNKLAVWTLEQAEA